MKSELEVIDRLHRTETAFVMATLRTLKYRNPGDNYYDEYMKHYKREGEKFYDQYHLAIAAAICRKPEKILEVGVRTGNSICNLLCAFTDRSIIERIVLVDTWNDDYISPGLVKLNMKAVGVGDVLDRTEFLTGTSATIMPELTGQFDYILIDGDHTKDVARQDLEDAIRLVAPGGIIVFDDLTIHGCDLMDVWQDFKEKHIKKFDFEENHHGKGVGWAIRK